MLFYALAAAVTVLLVFSLRRWAEQYRTFAAVTPADSPRYNSKKNSTYGFERAESLSESLHNLRDLAASARESVAPGKVFRSSKPDEHLESDPTLRDVVRTIVDLRDPDEAPAGALVAPSPKKVALPLVDHTAVRRWVFRSATLYEQVRFFVLLVVTCDLKLAGNSLVPVLGRLGVRRFYELILVQCASRVRKCLVLCADREKLPVLFHCTHGKDRTGLVSALLLHICNAGMDDIARDYAVSEMLLSETILNSVPESFPFEWRATPPATIRETWAMLRNKYGSVDGYLDEIGVDDALRERIRANICALSTQ